MLKVKIFFQKAVLHLSVGQEILTNTLSLGKILWENLVVDFVIVFSIILERTWGTIWSRNILLAIFPIRVISARKSFIPTMPWLVIKRNFININKDPCTKCRDFLFSIAEFHKVVIWDIFLVFDPWRSLEKGWDGGLLLCYSPMRDGVERSTSTQWTPTVCLDLIRLLLSFNGYFGSVR